MRYVTLYFNQSPIVCVDLHKPEWIDIIDGIYYADNRFRIPFLCMEQAPAQATLTAPPLPPLCLDSTDFCQVSCLARN